MTRSIDIIKGTLQFFLIIVLTAVLAEAQPNNETPNRNLLIVVDGLRPDYITPELMPILHAMGEQGVFGEQHAAAFPTVTRVNSPSISTGSYPVRHGIIHNTMWMSEMGEDSFSTGNAGNLRKLEDVAEGELLTAISAGELMEEAGRLFFVCGSGGTGNTLLQNHRGKGKGIWTTGAGSGGFFVPESGREKAMATIGEVPDNRPAETVWAFDAYLHHALGDNPPDFTLMWINELDAAGHSYGIGSPQVIEAIANIDRQISRIKEAHREHGLSEQINIFVTSDHGFTTNTGTFSVARILDEAGLSDDEIKVVSNMVYLQDENNLELLKKIVEALHRDEKVGAVYTKPARPGSPEGKVPGTISTAVIQWDHERGADVLISPAWSDQSNEFGFAGLTTRRGTATHGSDSPYDVRIRLVAVGPDIKSGVRSSVPTGNVDFIPTILHLLGIEPAESMNGRILYELLEGGPEPEIMLVHEHTHQASVKYPDGFRYLTELETMQIGSTFYLRGASTQREIID